MWKCVHASVGVVLAWGAAPDLHGQEPPARGEIERQRASAQGEARAPLLASLREDLASDDPLRIAWAAYDAGRWRLKELAPAIVTALELSPKRDLGPVRSSRPGTSYLKSHIEGEVDPDPDLDDPRTLQRFVPAVLLDALVEIDAIVPPNFLERVLLESTVRDTTTPNPFSYFRGARGPALALFARHTSEYPHLVDRALDLARRNELLVTDTLVWIAASACVASDPKKLAEKWITLPTWHVKIHVKGGRRSLELGKCGGVFLFWSIAWPDRFPPPAIHHFYATPVADAVCVVAKPIPLYWRRDSSLSMDAFTKDASTEPEEMPILLRDTYVVSMLRGAAELEPDPFTIASVQDVTVEWLDRESLLYFAREKRARIEADWSEVVAALIFHFRVEGPLPSRYPPSITVEFIDERGVELRRSDPLPEPP